MRALEARDVALGAGAGAEFDKQINKAYQIINDQAEQGKRNITLCSLVCEHGNPCFEAIKQRLVDDGYIIKTERRDSFGILQDPMEFVYW